MDGSTRPPESAEDGFTLIEVLITVALMSIAFVAVLGALTLMIATSAEHRGKTRAEAAARNAAEYIKSSDFSYASLTCGTGLNTPLAVPGVNAPLAVRVTAVRGWNGQENAVYDDVTCSSDPNAKLVELEVTGPGPGAELAVVKVAS